MKLIGMKVANTRSGKVIFSDGKINARLLEIDDLFDAYAVFEFLVFREYIRSGESEDFYKFLKNSKKFGELLGSKRLKKVKEKLGILNAFALRDYGRSLVALEFQNISRG